MSVDLNIGAGMAWLNLIIRWSCASEAEIRSDQKRRGDSIGMSVYTTGLWNQPLLQLEEEEHSVYFNLRANLLKLKLLT